MCGLRKLVVLSCAGAPLTWLFATKKSSVATPGTAAVAVASGPDETPATAAAAVATRPAPPPPLSTPCVSTVFDCVRCRQHTSMDMGWSAVCKDCAVCSIEDVPYSLSSAQAIRFRPSTASVGLKLGGSPRMRHRMYIRVNTAQLKPSFCCGAGKEVCFRVCTLLTTFDSGTHAFSPSDKFVMLFSSPLSFLSKSTHRIYQCWL